MLAEDQPIVQLGLRKLLEEASARIELVGVVTSYEELASHPALGQTDVLLLDLHVQQAAGADPLPRLIAEHGIDVVLLADEDNHLLHRNAVMRGALGVVMKSRPLEELVQAIERVHAGEVWLERSLMAKLIRDRVSADSPTPRAVDEHARRIQSLTPKEREVIAALVEHRGAKSFIVAEALGISERTVRNRLTFIYEKLRVRGKLNLYVYALEHGLGPEGAAAGVAALHRN